MWAVLGSLNAYLVVSAVIQFRLGGPTDWRIFESTAESILAGTDPYVELDPAAHLAFRWSPIAAFLLVPITRLPFALWALLHAAALTLLPERRVALLVAVSWPFALDLLDGGVMVFVAVAGYWALRGNRFGIAATLLLAILIPRPLIVPLLLWILWTNPRWRIAFLALVAVHAVAVVATGWGDEWIARLATSGSDVGNVFNISPSRLVGPWWLAIGIPLGVLLLRAGRIGWSCLAVSPYILPPYLLILLLEQPGLYAEHLTPTTRYEIAIRRQRRIPTVATHYLRRCGWQPARATHTQSSPSLTFLPSGSGPSG